MGGSAVSASAGLLERSRPGEHKVPVRLREPTPPGGNSRAAVLLTGARGTGRHRVAGPGPPRSLPRPRNISPTKGESTRARARLRSLPPTHTPAPCDTRGGGVAADRPAPTRETGALLGLTASTPQDETVFLSSHSHLGNPHGPGETRHEAAASAAVPGRGAATHRLSLGHLKRQPGPLQEHHGGPRQRRTRAPRRRGGSPPQGGGRATRTRPGHQRRVASEKHPLRQQTPGRGPGRIPHPCLPHAAKGQGGEARGPRAGREERSRSP